MDVLLAAFKSKISDGYVCVCIYACARMHTHAHTHLIQILNCTHVFSIAALKVTINLATQNNKYLLSGDFSYLSVMLIFKHSGC